MAATETPKTGHIILTTIDADWTWGGNEPLKMLGYLFIPGNANDLIVVKYDTDAGAVLCQPNSNSVLSESITFPSPIYATPMIDFSDCTLNAGHQLTIFIG